MNNSLSLLLLCCLVSCNPIKNHPIEHSNGTPIPDSLCYFFPPQYVTATRHIVGDITCDCVNPSGICDYFVIVEKTYLHCDYDSLVSFAKTKSTQILNDTSEYIPIKNRDFDKREIIDSAYLGVKIEQIIPDFQQLESLNNKWLDTSTRSGLSSGYTFYIIKSGNTLALNDKWNCHRLWLPKTLQHAYRSGIAINPDNDYIVFWAMAW